MQKDFVKTQEKLESVVFHFEEKDTPAPKVLLPFHLPLFIGVRLFLKV
jgi:hypothetical protein